MSLLWDITVIVGNHHLFQTDENEKEIKVSNIIIHEGFDLEYNYDDYYDYTDYENDICLLILSEKADNSSSSVGFIELPDENTEYR